MMDALNDRDTERQARDDRRQKSLAAFGEVWRRRWLVLGMSFGVALVTAVINFFFLWPYYKSIGTLLPETNRNRLAGLGSLASLADLAGVNVGGGELLTKLYPAIAKSNTVLTPVVLKQFDNTRYQKPMNILDYFDVRGDSPQERLDKGLKMMRDLVDVSVDAKTNLITLSVLMPEPELAAQVLNSIVQQMDDFLRHKQNTSATEQARWISTRLDSVKQELEVAQDRLRDFRQKNRVISESPELMLRQERLMLEVQVKSTVYTELKKQYELAKIDEIKSMSVVNVLDHGSLPIKKDKPKRATNTVIGFFLSIVLMSAYWGWGRPFLLLQFRRLRPALSRE